MADRYAPDPRLAVDLGAGLRLRNPVMPASGCFGAELGALVDLNTLGALVTKTIFYGSRAGNPSPRLAETPAGMLNSVGIRRAASRTFWLASSRLTSAMRARPS